MWAHFLFKMSEKLPQIAETMPFGQATIDS